MKLYDTITDIESLNRKRISYHRPLSLGLIGTNIDQ